MPCIHYSIILVTHRFAQSSGTLCETLSEARISSCSCPPVCFLIDCPVMALTATATPLVRSDIVDNLDLVNPEIVCTGFNRDNLYLSVSQMTSMRDDLDKLLVAEDNIQVVEHEREVLQVFGSGSVWFSYCTILHRRAGVGSRKEGQKERRIHAAKTTKRRISEERRLLVIFKLSAPLALS
ncbi:unnamed protein product [Heligmosomoides polygyrus]|uniref:Elf4 domain-containing protein n=1 Tax=Heligmosomoides polygyrus TaxID=6339 RepID=A0A183FEN7_HELPZ|nr:unnamed protein product [Heligmosomoides polygyrus]